VTALQTAPPVIRLTGVGKRYVKYEDAPMLLTRVAGLRARTQRSRLWAVRGVDLEVGPGECLGVVGRNGSGKSTLLRMLAGVTGPTEGRVTVRGRIAPLISVGVGFHRELTGRENIYVNGTILGLSRSQIDARLDEIIDFAQVGPFVDTPVKFYSSGMFVRLGFAVAVAADPDLLLVDEVLAVGDLAFQIKCFERMREIKDRGATIVVVSHNLNAIRMLCPRTVTMHQGRMHYDGPTEGALSLFHQLMAVEDPEDRSGPLDTRPSGVQPDARFDPVRIIGEDGAPTAHLRTGDPARFRIGVHFDRPLADPVVQLRILSDRGIMVCEQSHHFEGRSYEPGDHEVFEAELDVRLGTGSYTATAEIITHHDFVARAASAPAALFYVAGRPVSTGLVDLDARFRAASAPSPQA
jgi:ABC-type polysaccharide/polyol phosphate transport system ATPase subunit